MGNETDAVVGEVTEVSKPHLLLVTISYSGQETRSIVWDIEDAKIKEIKNEFGDIIAQPCSFNETDYWLSTTSAVSKDLLSRPSPYSYFINLIYCDYDNPNSSRESPVLDISGTFYPIDTCAWTHVSHGAKKEILDNAYPGKITTFLNSSGVLSCHKRKYDYLWDYHHYDLNERDYYLQRDIDETWRLQFISPIGSSEIITVEKHTHASRLDERLHFTIDSTSGYYVPADFIPTYAAAYSERAIAQIYCFQYKIVDEVTGIIHRYIEISAQADMVNDGETQDPRSPSKSPTLEAAIANLFSNFYTVNDIPASVMKKVIISIQIRK